jgi:hypothetical protein
MPSSTTPGIASMFECPYCLEEIAAGEPFFAINCGAELLHLECWTRMLVGSVGHQRRTCSCFGGTQEDPEGATRREAARAAAKEFRLRAGG